MVRLSEQIGIRLEKEEKNLLEKVCDARGEHVSNFVRRALKKELASLSFYSDETKKALGILREVET